MQRITLKLAIMVLTFVAGTTIASSWATHQSNLASKKRISTTRVLEITGKLHEAEVKKDIESLNRITPDDFTWTMIDCSPIGKSKWLYLFENGGFRWNVIDVDNVETIIDKDKAIVTGRITILMTFSTDRHRLIDKSISSFTYRFEIRQGHWEIISAGFDYSK